ncbi:hypothetical protein PGB90_008072 [Kerria lacca]
MTDENIPSIVLGEASESDEDDYLQENIYDHSMKYSIGNLNSIQRKQVVDLDDQIESHNCQSLNNNKTGGPKTLNSSGQIKSNSLKKLQERNGALYKNLVSFTKQIFNSSNYELININQQLLKSQIELQQTLLNMRSMKNNLHHYEKKLNDIILADYIPNINIKVPAHII